MWNMYQGSPFQHRNFQSFQHHFLKRLPLFIKLPLHLCQKSVDNIYVHLFLTSLFCSTDLCVLPLPIPYSLDYCNFIVIIEIRQCESSNFVPLFQNCFAYSNSCVCVYTYSHVLINIHIYRKETHIYRKVSWFWLGLNWIYTSHIRENWDLNNIESSNP